jgi:glycosyltransferase involved in cell wall biosynthesis
MSAGLAVIATDHSGIPYTVRDGEEGLIVPPGDVPTLARAIRRLIEDTQLRVRFGEAARRRYEEVYRPEAFREAVAELLIASGGSDAGLAASGSGRTLQRDR